MATSPKVNAATVGAAFTTIIAGIVGPHIFPHDLAPDVAGLITAGVTALVTFGSGWLAKDLAKVEQELAPKVEPVVKAAETIYTQVREADPVGVADVAHALEVEARKVAPTVANVILPVAKAI